MPDTLPKARLDEVQERRVPRSEYWRGFADAIYRAADVAKTLGPHPSPREVRSTILDLIKADQPDNRPNARNEIEGDLP